MGNFNRDKGFRPKLQMYKAICDDCGKSCELPFKPSNDKPVFCSDCFKNKGRGGKEELLDLRGPKKMFQAVCNKCGKDCEVPFRPSSDKPVYCDSCFKNIDRPSRDRGGSRKDSRGGGDRSGNRAPSSQGGGVQLEMLNTKLDQILEILTTPKASRKKIKVEEESINETVVKKATKASSILGKKTPVKKAVKKTTKKTGKKLAVKKVAVKKAKKK